MQRAFITLLLMVFLACGPARAEDRNPGREFGLAGASVGANLLYTPPKLLTALIGLPVGALTGVFTGLDLRSMYAVWVPTVFSKNRDRLLEGDIAQAFFDAVLSQARTKDLLSDDHFSVDGTLLEAWASQKSYQKRKDPPKRCSPRRDRAGGSVVELVAGWLRGQAQGERM